MYIVHLENFVSNYNHIMMYIVHTELRGLGAPRAGHFGGAEALGRCQHRHAGAQN
jgi:hypothetical protein